MSDLVRALTPLIDRLDALFDRLETILPPSLPPTDWAATAFRRAATAGSGWSSKMTPSMILSGASSSRAAVISGKFSRA